ncbi:nucleotidyl transferase AbiEii/AbiGii toxin family protein [Candidatus Woesearchaeota archaeon]|nr:nucleotidyl transferase AbiEii/AbiGii toxin family protein [Candidatus Woesearchaeota archaeon]
MIPLILKIKKASHKSIAEAQDIIIRELYSVLDTAAFHGGTAIWRCYQGNRFSEDIDMYIPRDIAKINQFFSNLEKKGFIVQKKRFTDNALYSNLLFNRVEVRFEAAFRKVKGILKDYEAVEGNFIAVYTLSAEEFIREKTAAYLSRKKIRDLYDIFHLLKYVQDKEKIKQEIAELINNYSAPVDEKDIKTLILEGLVPTSKKMIEYIRDYR